LLGNHYSHPVSSICQVNYKNKESSFLYQPSDEAIYD